jgi:N-formylglutamate amidohydrolase
MNVLSSSDRYSTALDQRFKGGYITRQYGRPEDNIHVVQLQLSQATYMDDVVPHKYRNDLACQVRPVLERFMAVLVEWSWEHAEGRRQRVAYY